MAKDYESMSVAELEAANYKLMAQRTAVGEEQDKLKAALNRKLTEERVGLQVEGMSDVERAVLVKALTAKVKAQG